MKTKKNENLEKGRLIKADIVSRPNAMNGKYKIGRLLELELNNVVKVKDSVIFFLETLKMKADLADKMIDEAESRGKDTSDQKVMRELGEEINAVATPLHKSESIMTAIFVSFHLIVYYGIAIGIWGLVFKKSFLIFGFYGIIAGLLISLLFVAPVIAFQRIKEKVRDMSFGAGATWGNLGIIIGAVGLIALVIKLVFFIE